MQGLSTHTFNLDGAEQIPNPNATSHCIKDSRYGEGDQSIGDATSGVPLGFVGEEQELAPGLIPVQIFVIARPSQHQCLALEGWTSQAKIGAFRSVLVACFTVAGWWLDASDA